MTGSYWALDIATKFDEIIERLDRIEGLLGPLPDKEDAPPSLADALANIRQCLSFPPAMAEERVLDFLALWPGGWRVSWYRDMRDGNWQATIARQRGTETEYRTAHHTDLARAIAEAARKHLE